LKKKILSRKKKGQQRKGGRNAKKLGKAINLFCFCLFHFVSVKLLEKKQLLCFCKSLKSTPLPIIYHDFVCHPKKKTTQSGPVKPLHVFQTECPIDGFFLFSFLPRDGKFVGFAKVGLRDGFAIGLVNVGECVKVNRLEQRLLVFLKVFLRETLLGKNWGFWMENVLNLG
jgi:hypothetical protein